MNLLQFVRGVIREELRYLHTGFIGQVVAVNMAAKLPTCDVQILVKRSVLSNENTEMTYREYPILRDVPLVFPRTSAALVEHKVAPGDYVEVRCMYHSIDELLTQDVNGPVEPADGRLHALQDAIATPISFGSTWAHRSTLADYQIEGDDIRFGAPNTAKALVTDDGTATGLQKVLHGYLKNLETWIQTGVAPPGGGTVTYAASPPAKPTIPKTSHLKGS